MQILAAEGLAAGARSPARLLDERDGAYRGDPGSLRVRTRWLVLCGGLYEFLYRLLPYNSSTSFRFNNSVDSQFLMAIEAAQFAKENALDEKTRNFAISLLDEWGAN